MSNILHKIRNNYGNTLLDTIFTVECIYKVKNTVFDQFVLKSK